MTRRRVPLWAAVAVSLAGLVLLGLLQSMPNRHRMEGDLTRRSTVALDQAGVGVTRLSFTGRDASVTVVSAADTERAREAVLGVAGVRVVEVVTPSAPLRKPSITVVFDTAGVRVTGAVASEAVRAQLVSRFGAQPGLTVDSGVGSDGVDALSAVADALGAAPDGVSIALAEGRVTLNGIVAASGVRDAAVAAAGRVVGTGNVADRLTVVVAPSPEQVQRDLVSLPPITFENGSAILTATGRAAVVRAAEILRTNPSVRVRIDGHTDSTGSAESNLDLSRARAQSVLDSLVAHGVSRERLSAYGFGESRPKVPDTTPENRAINRRVEFIVQNS